MIITRESIDSYSKRHAGGKGYQLHLLTKAGFPVPNWRIVGSKIFKDFKNAHDIESKFQKFLAENPEDWKKVSLYMEELIESLEYPDHLEKMIEDAYSDINCKSIAVRSSAIDEDGVKHSFAGQLSSYLFVRSKEGALDSIKKCWASAYSERVLAYRYRNKISINDIEVGVVLQEMVDADKAGVVFTCDPITGDPTLNTINGVYGVGEGLVSGALDGDTFLIKKENCEIIKKEIAEKNSMMTHSPSNDGIIEKDVPASQANIPVLDEKQLKELSKLSIQIENFYGFAQDIEWAIKDNKIYILQARPVTSEVKSNSGRLNIWDNSNIIESYGGLTKPLTFGFAKRCYHSVYVQFCEVLLVPHKHIRQMDSFLANMLGLQYGRVYYNLLNWYKLTSILPGFKYNRSFMETMMGTDKSLEDEIADRIKPPAFEESFKSKLRRFITGAKFFYFHRNIQKIVDDFLKYFNENYDRFRKIDYERLSIDDIYQYYLEVEQVMLWHWKAPIINDFLCMVHFGMLRKLCNSWFKDLGEGFHNDLLAGDGHYESAEPTREIMKMAEYVKKHPKLETLIMESEPEECLEKVNQSEFKEFYQRLLNYIDLYGFRCMSEMKLEQKDLHQKPETLFVFLKNQLKAKTASLEELHEKEQEIRKCAEDKAKSKLSGWRRFLFFRTLHHARKAVRNRENTRFCRTRVYGVVRSMFFAAGKELERRDIIERDEDVFF